MIRFCRRAGRGRADLDAEVAARDLTASVSARMSSRTSTASAFSILAMTCACEPACSSRARRSSRTSAGEPTNRSATKSTPDLERESRWQCPCGQRRDRQRDARKVDALVRCDVPANEHLALCAALFHLVDTEADEAVVDEDVVPGSSTSPITAGAIGSSPLLDASSAHTVISSPARRTTGS